jgi:hypothetical protein
MVRGGRPHRGRGGRDGRRSLIRHLASYGASCCARAPDTPSASTARRAELGRPRPASLRSAAGDARWGVMDAANDHRCSRSVARPCARDIVVTSGTRTVASFPVQDGRAAAARRVPVLLRRCAC